MVYFRFFKSRYSLVRIQGDPTYQIRRADKRVEHRFLEKRSDREVYKFFLKEGHVYDYLYHMKRKLLPSQNSKAMAIAIVAGILLLIAGVNGVATWETIKSVVTTHIIDNSIVQMLFVVLIFIASLGGIAVITGGIVIGKDIIGAGKFLIALGAGLGLIGLIVSIVVASIEKNLDASSFLSIGAVGLILSVVARTVIERE